jgi:lipopolysaccharide export system permease protein
MGEIPGKICLTPGIYRNNRLKERAMLLLSRYVLKSVALTTLLVSLVLTLIIWLTQSLRLLDFIINSGAPLGLFGKMLLLTIPKFFEIILPISLALSILYTLNKYSIDSELVVMQNTGISPRRLGQGVFYFTTIIALTVFLLTGWVTPLANRELDRVRDVIKSDYSLGLLRPGIFNTISDDTTIYIAQRTSLQDLRGVFIHFNKKDEIPMTITAEHGGLIMRGKKPTVVVFDGMRQQFNPETGTVETLRFERYSLDLSSLASQVMGAQKIDPEDRTLGELYNAKLAAREMKSAMKMNGEFHGRLARPFLAVALAMLAVIPFLVGRYNRRGQTIRAFLIVTSLLALQSLHIGALHLASTSPLGVMALYAFPIGAIVLFGFVLFNDGDYGLILAPIQWLLGGKERLI